MTGGPLGICEDRVERLGQLCFESYADAIVLVGEDQDLLEEGLVEQTPDVLGSAQVGGVGVGRQVEREPEVALDHLPLLVGAVELGLDAGQRLADAVLLLPEQVDRNGARVVGLHELAALPVQPLLLLPELYASPFDLASTVTELGPHLRLDVVAEGGVELDPQIEVFNLALDLVDQHGTLAAVGALGMPPGAVEVWVDVAAGGA